MCHANHLPDNVMTPEPWVASGQYLLNRELPPSTCHPFGDCDAVQSGQECYESYGGILIAESMRRTDAERAAVCVNALAGIPSELLAEGWLSQILAMVGDAFVHLEHCGDTELRERLRMLMAVSIHATVEVGMARYRLSPGEAEIFNWVGYVRRGDPLGVAP